jgi:hypothetical protein
LLIDTGIENRWIVSLSLSFSLSHSHSLSLSFPTLTLLRRDARPSTGSNDKSATTLRRSDGFATCRRDKRLPVATFRKRQFQKTGFNGKKTFFDLSSIIEGSNEISYTIFKTIGNDILISRRIFSHVRPFYEWAVSNLDL